MVATAARVATASAAGEAWVLSLSAGNTVAEIWLGGGWSTSPLAAVLVAEAWTGPGAILEELLGTLWHLWEEGGGDLPLLGLSWALWRGAVAAGAAVTAWVWSSLVGGLQTLEVLVWYDLAVLDLDQSITVGLESVLVGETTGVGDSHLWGVEGLDLVPFTGVGDATELGQEEWQTVVGVGLDLGRPAGLLVGGWVAPGVVVEGEEVGAGDVVLTAGEVEGLRLDVLGNVGGGVADWNFTRGLGADVVLHVTGDGLDVWGGVGVVAGVDDFVAGEEEEQVAWRVLVSLRGKLHDGVTYCSQRKRRW